MSPTGATEPAKKSALSDEKAPSRPSEAPLAEVALSAEGAAGQVPEGHTPPEFPPISSATLTTHQAPLEVGDDEEEGIEDGITSDTESAYSTSVSSSVMAHVFENGRRYHRYREGKYNFPNDEREQEREDMKHACVLNLCEGNLLYAPVGEYPQNIIDLGTGTGIWAIEMAERFPSAIVTGVDLSPIQPSWVPPNVKFTVDDIEDRFVYPINHFDMIHIRNVIHHLRDVPQLLRQCYRHIKPGGWMEIQEHEINLYCDDGTMPPDYAVHVLFAYVREAMAKFGMDATMILKVDELLREAGFINISRRVMKIPEGPWARGQSQKLTGLFWRTILLEGVEGIALKPLEKGLHWSREEIEVFLVDVRKQLMDPSIHTYWPFHVVTAQKAP
ncbi:MAG: hypothetical protein M1818_002753 [Claussenomyces sp. TS43310]|nr:MAG: hypothetical protein M1818_002753 [Claussenomyces sp. TS43310]